VFEDRHDACIPMNNKEGPDLLEMVFVAFVLAGIAYSFTH